ncbi:hypothetical protein N7533_002801 [Penicillium manginii]|uniref:uncharacterized protein n=1 Tax=Penicillium manginii TaxID=203109 RepID=UPI0025480E5D|nr:uncharacterized protein N7533_002801 [Penicillium manginii]KAJ5764120.1 hypothetical protein N7533_002801 [Penicillium manginii]
MRFSTATIALFASLAAAAVQNGADSTVYQTDEVTVISCAASVTDCPGRTSTPAAGVEPTTTPAGVEPTTTPVGVEPTTGAPSGPAGGNPPCLLRPCPQLSYSLTTFTSCIPTVITSQVPVSSAPGGGSPVGPGSGGVPHVPSSSAAVPSGTSPVSPSGTPAFNGAGAVSGSLTFAGVAAAAAFFLA